MAKKTIKLTGQNKQTLKFLEKLPYKTPYLVIDTQRIASTYQDFSKLMPKFDIHYAVKCNPAEPILRILHQNGSKFEIAAYGELERLIKIGIDPKTVIYSNTVKPAEHIKAAFNKGVKQYAFDSAEELEKLSIYAPNSEVCLRVFVDNLGSLVNLSSKFGAHHKDAVSLMVRAQKLGLQPIGLTFHVGSQSEKLSPWYNAMKLMKSIRNELEAKNIYITKLNIGGGFPIQYADKLPSIEKITQIIHKSLEKHKLNDLVLQCEPGRYLVGESGIIGATIIGKVARQNRDWIYLDVGRFQAFVEMFESEGLRYPLLSSKDFGLRVKTKKYTITGPSCDSYDTIMSNVVLPSNLEIGDKVYFLSAGSYTTVYGAPFNDFPVPQQEFI